MSTGDVLYRVHEKDKGWSAWYGNGYVAGTVGESRRIEAIQLATNLPIEFRVHMKDVGWGPWCTPGSPVGGNGETAGSVGEGRRLEALQIRSVDKTNPVAIWYQVHVANIGWYAWAQAGETCGTTGEAIRMEAIRITTTTPPISDAVAQSQSEAGRTVYESDPHIYLQQNGKVYDCAVDGEISITREPNKPSKLSCTILRDSITPENGDIIAMKLDGAHNQFYGYIFCTSKKGIKCAITAYDQLIYMQRNKETRSYENMTANALLMKIIDDYKLKTLDPPTIVDTGYSIPSRIEENVSLLDMLCTALDLTKQNTGKQYYLWDDFGALSLCEEGWFAIVTSQASLGYLQDYSYNESLDDYYNKVKLDEKKDSNVEKSYVRDNAAQQERYGMLQYYDVLQDGENGDVKAAQLLADKCRIIPKFTVSGMQGDIRVRGGTPIHLDFFSEDHAEYLRGWYRTLSVTHKIGSGVHTMDIDLELIYSEDDGWITNAEYNLDTPVLKYQVHAMDIGCTGYVEAPGTAGTVGQARRLEAIQIQTNLRIMYRAHQAEIGWSAWKIPGEIAGTTGQKRQIEAVEIKSADGSTVKMQYRAHVQDIGWGAWTDIGGIAGTTGQGLRIEAIEMRIIDG